MSNPNPNISKRYEVVDADDNTDDDHGFQSFRSTSPPVARVATTPRFRDGRLPNGQLINAKNTLQSFDHFVAQQQQTPIVPNPPIVNTPNLSVGSNGGGFNDEVAEAPNTILIQHNIDNGMKEKSNNVSATYIRLVVVLSVIIVVIIAAVGVGFGVYCGNGNCGTGAKSNSAATAPPTVPNATTPSPGSTVNTTKVTTPPTDTPSVPSISTRLPTVNISMVPSLALTRTPATNGQTKSPVSGQQLAAACNFLSLTNFTVCQTITEVVDVRIGSTIPTEIGLLTQITSLILHGNQLTGTIPSTLESLTKLIYLGLNNNKLIGTIPSTIGNLVLLTLLSVWDNQLTGTIPSTLGNLVLLDTFDVTSNRFTGTIPSELGNLSRLTDLYLADNANLIGSIPSSLCFRSRDLGIFVDCANVECACCFVGSMWPNRTSCPATNST